MSTKAMQQAIADYFKTQPVQRAWLFGSFARGEETPLSDVDLLIVYDDKARVSLLKHAAIICELEKILDRPVDVVQEKTLRPRVRESVNKDRKLIYERERWRPRPTGRNGRRTRLSSRNQPYTRILCRLPAA